MPINDPTPAVSCRYGAPMGRHTGNPDPDAQGRFQLRKVNLDSGGYDSGGAYWGHGQQLYWYCSGDGTAEGFLRLDPARRSALAATMRANGDDPLEYGSAGLDRRTAKAQVWDLHPNAIFYR